LRGVEKDTGKTPLALQRKPQLSHQAAFYHEVFWALNVAREPSPYGLVPLQPTQILAAADMFGVSTPDEREHLFAFITRLDVEYRQIQLDLAKKEAEAEKLKVAAKAAVK